MQILLKKGKVSTYKSFAFALGFTVIDRTTGKSWSFRPGTVNTAKDLRVGLIKRLKNNFTLKSIIQNLNETTVERGLSNLLLGTYSSWHNLIITVNVLNLFQSVAHTTNKKINEKNQAKLVSGKQTNVNSKAVSSNFIKELSSVKFLLETLQIGFLENLYQKGDSRSQFPPEPALYAVINLATQTSYIGETKNLKRRAYDPISSLNMRRHSCPGLREDWKKYGSHSFMFKVLKLAKPCAGLSHVPVDPQLNDTSLRRELERNFTESWPGKVYNPTNLKQPRYTSEVTLPRHAVMVDGKIYPSYTAAAKETGRTVGSIRHAVGSLVQKTVFCLEHVEKVKQGNKLVFVPPTKDYINIDGVVLSVKEVLQKFNLKTGELVKRLESGKTWSSWRFAFQSEINKQ